MIATTVVIQAVDISSSHPRIARNRLSEIPGVKRCQHGKYGDPDKENNPAPLHVDGLIRHGGPHREQQPIRNKEQWN